MSTLHLPKPRTEIREKSRQQWDKQGERGPFRILLIPEQRQDIRRYYAANSNGLFWTTFREVAREFPALHMAENIVTRIIANNAKLRGRVRIVPV